MEASATGGQYGRRLGIKIDSWSPSCSFRAGVRARERSFDRTGLKNEIVNKEGAGRHPEAQS